MAGEVEIDVEIVEDDGQETVFYTDRTAIVTDWSCGMKLWWNRKEGGIGMTPVQEAAYYHQGRDTHEDLAGIAEMEDLSEAAVSEAVEVLLQQAKVADLLQPAREALYRRLGWLSAFALFVEPGIRAQFDNVSIEDELILDRTPLWVGITPDRLLRHRDRGYLVYREYKTTISASSKWVNHWPYAVQVHLGLKAIEEELNEKPAYGQIVGLMKGDDRFGRLVHPYVWAYRRGDEWRSDYVPGWDHAPVWEYPGGIVEWVQRLGKETATGQFPHSAPIFCNDRLLDNLISARKAREFEISEVQERCQTDLDARRIYFEQRFEQCRPAFGDPCPFLEACHNARINQDPLSSGLYQVRKPHHEIEVQLRAAGEI